MDNTQCSESMQNFTNWYKGHSRAYLLVEAWHGIITHLEKEKKEVKGEIDICEFTGTDVQSLDQNYQLFNNIKRTKLVKISGLRRFIIDFW